MPGTVAVSHALNYAQLPPSILKNPDIITQVCCIYLLILNQTKKLLLLLFVIYSQPQNEQKKPQVSMSYLTETDMLKLARCAFIWDGKSEGGLSLLQTLEISLSLS